MGSFSPSNSQSASLVSSTHIVSYIRLRATACAASPSNFSAGSRSGRRSATSRSWRHRRAVVTNFVDPYFERVKPDQVVAILKAREPARIMTAIGDKVVNPWHLQFAQRWVDQYNFYINDRNWDECSCAFAPTFHSP